VSRFLRAEVQSRDAAKLTVIQDLSAPGLDGGIRNSLRIIGLFNVGFKVTTRHNLCVHPGKRCAILQAM
jgi:hypothetical protein